MKQKFLVINCDEKDLEVLRQQLGGRNVVSCESIDEIARYLPSTSTAVLVSPPAHDVPMNGSASSAVRSQDVDELVERVLEQSNGHAKSLAARVDLLEQKIIEYSLIRNGQHRKETAAELGISRVTLYNKMKKFGLLD
jgi:DNA-binding NtrC family response regulator